MEAIISKKEQIPLKVLFHSWKNLAHSYGIVSAFLLIHLELNYGPNGKIKRNAIDIYVEEAPYFNPEWNNKVKLVYNEEYNQILKNLKVYNGEPIDIIYRQTYPYNINVTNENKDIPKCVFYTSEFAKLAESYFSLQKPTDLENSKYNDYIKLFLDNFKNIYFTAPSEWSARGMIEYLDNKETSPRNRIITHGVDTSIFKKHTNNLIRNQIREKYKVKQDEILMINIGAMTTNKGILLILECLNTLVHRMPKLIEGEAPRKIFKLMLKGSGELYKCKDFLNIYFDEFKKNRKMTSEEIDNLLENHIIFTDKTLSFDRINDLFNACDLYVSPYLAEGFNLAPLEAISSGLQVIIPKTGSTKEYIEAIYNNGGSEYITYVDSVVGMDQNGLCQNIITIENLLSVLNNTDFKKEKKNYQQMIDYINKELSWDHVSTLLFDYLNEIVSGNLI
jgi:glycosyltransferase involved in cell wall biosynthesis